MKKKSPTKLPPTRNRQGRKPGPKPKTPFIERALHGLCERLENGGHLSDKEVLFFCALLEAHRAKSLLTEGDLIRSWEARFEQLEGWINTQQALQAAISGTRRRTPSQVGPPNFNASIRQERGVNLGHETPPG